MPDTSHTYRTTLEWTEKRHGIAHAGERPAISVGAPPEFGGDEFAWSPEHLCVASLNTCLMLTFVAVAQNSKVPFVSYAASAEGILEKVEGRGMVITRIVVRPQIVVPADVDAARVEQLVRMAKRNCFISNSLTAEVVVEPEITTA